MSSGSWPRTSQRLLRPRLLPRRPPRPRTLALVVLVGVLAWVGWVWYQGSSFVRVRHVTVTGLSGPEVSQIRAALTDTALGMTTMDVQVTKLERAVQSFPYVESITVVSRGAHAVTIEVTEQVPVALVEVGGEAQVVDGRDQILTDSTIPHGLLPRVPLRSPPTGGTVTAAGARAAVATLAAAPYALLAHIQSATWNADHGVVAQLRGGPQIYFGPDDELERKWQAAVAVLQNSDSAGAGYIDVTDPQRPAAGVSVSAQEAQSLGLVTDASAAGQPSSPGSTASTATAASGTAATTGASPASTSPAVGP